MREMSFSKLDWLNHTTGKPKLTQPSFTTFRFTRRDKDWAVGEVVRVVYQARNKRNRSILGQAVIKAKKAVDINHIEIRDIMADGFATRYDMAQWLRKGGGNRYIFEKVNRLVLVWTQVWLWLPEQKPLVAAKWADMWRARNDDLGLMVPKRKYKPGITIQPMPAEVASD